MREMTTLDRIELLHIADFMTAGTTAGWIRAAVERYEGFSPVEKQQLQTPARLLADYLQLHQRPLPDPMLLQLACLAPAVIRGSNDPIATVSEKRGGYTEKKLSESARWVEEAMRLLRAYETLPLDQRVSLSSYARSFGVSVPPETGDHPEVLLGGLARLAHPHWRYRRSSRRDLEQAYGELSTNEGRRLAGRALELWRRDLGTYEELTREIMLHLACLVPEALSGYHAELARGGMLWPPELYREADSSARDYLLNRLKSCTPDEHSVWLVRLLGALAWIGDEVIQAKFGYWRQSPPAWDTGIFRLIQFVTRYAGWELTGPGKRRLLYHRECYRLLSVDDVPASHLPGPVRVITSHEGQCGWCGRPLTALLDIDLRDSRVAFLAATWERLRIATCERCGSFTTVFTEVDGRGGSRWRACGDRPQHIGTEVDAWRFPYSRLALGPPRRTAYEAHQFVLTGGASQIGGFPMWIQQTTHPDCPNCGRAMVFVGQVQPDDVLGEPAEGVIYAFLCQECGMAATTYEQT